MIVKATAFLTMLPGNAINKPAVALGTAGSKEGGKETSQVLMQ